MMKRLLPAILACCCAGCATIQRATDYHGAGIENGETPIETVEIENTDRIFLKLIQTGSVTGDEIMRLVFRINRHVHKIQAYMTGLGFDDCRFDIRPLLSVIPHHDTGSLILC